jgi:tetratricopeptide (TPR) repeat protein
MNAKDIYQQGLTKAIAGAYQEAIRDFNQVLEMNDHVLDVYYNRGLAHYKLGNLEAAINDFSKTLVARNVNGFQMLDESLTVQAHVYRGLAHHQLGNHSKALDDYSEALMLDFRCARAYRNRGLLYLELGKNEAALEDFQTAAQIYSEQGNTQGYEHTQNLIEILL